MKTTVTYEQVNAFRMAALSWMAHDESRKDTKLGYAISRVMTRAEKLMQQMANIREDLHIDHCVVDDKSVIVHDERGNYKFTKPELKKLNVKLQQLFESSVEIEPYFATEIPAGLSFVEIEHFTGFVLRPAVSEVTESLPAV